MLKLLEDTTLIEKIAEEEGIILTSEKIIEIKNRVNNIIAYYINNGDIDHTQKELIIIKIQEPKKIDNNSFAEMALNVFDLFKEINPDGEFLFSRKTFNIYLNSYTNVEDFLSYLGNINIRLKVLKIKFGAPIEIGTNVFFLKSKNTKFIETKIIKIRSDGYLELEGLGGFHNPNRVFKSKSEIINFES